MTTIVEMPLRLSEKTKRINDSRDEFYSEIRKSQIVTYTREFFADCFEDDPRFLKAINVRVYKLNPKQQPRMNNYAFTWEDIPRGEEELWKEYRLKVDNQLKKFLSDLEENCNIVEGSIF